MQGLALMASMPKAPIGNTQAGGGASDAAALEDTGFAALLAAQIKGAASDASVPGAGVAVEDLLSADAALTDAKLDDSPVSGAVDPMLSGIALIPVLPAQAGVAQAQQSSLEQAASESLVSDVAGAGSQVISTEGRGDLASSFGRTPLDRKGEAVVPMAQGTADRELDPSRLVLNSTGREKVAEFAVGGKALPLEQEIKAVDARVPLPGAADLQRQPDPAAGTLSAAMTAVQSAPLPESKTVAMSTVQVPVGAAGWGDALGQKVVWMAGQQQQVAELHLNPPHLGPMEVRLTVSNDQVNAIFVSAQPAVRDAIEAAMPRLREMFADSGMTLGNAMVGSDSLPQQQNASQEGYSPRSGFSPASDASVPNVARGSMSLRGDGRGMVDLFA